MKPYLIVAPRYRHYHMGIRVLNLLCSELNNKGIDAYITGSTEESKSEFNLKRAEDLSVKELKDLQYNGIVVYHSLVPDNPYNFTNVVRWWLGPYISSYVNSISFGYTPVQNELIKPEGYLGLIHIESFFCLPEKENRKYICYYFGKIKEDKKLVPTEDNSVIITLDFPKERKQLAQYLQQAKILYCYDNFTTIIDESLLCGCSVILMNNSLFTKEYYKENSRFGLMGIGFQDEQYDIDDLKNQIPEFINKYKEYLEKTKKELNIFIEKTQAWNPNNIYVNNNLSNRVAKYDSEVFSNPICNVLKTREYY